MLSGRSSARIAKRLGKRRFQEQLSPGLFPSDHFCGIPRKVYGERAGDIISSIRALRRAGIQVGLPHRIADGVVFFQLDDYTLTVSQILEFARREPA